ncbi:MAG TPA: PKD domain-containing protein [Planctomycetota bacterium]|nr:PKD domain-containing protein [Planctomycetota bacterium]
MHKKTLIRMAIAASIIGLVVMSCDPKETDEDGASPLPVSIPAPQPDPTPDPVPTPVPPAAEPATYASRTSGVAPLAVFFDAVSTTSPAFDSGVVQPANGDYNSFHYSWNFGDPNSGTWSTDGRSRNLDTGYTAAHVFESAGVYDVQLTVTDASGAVHAYVQEITVAAFTGTTYYVSSVSGNNSNDGLTESTPWQTVSRAFQSLAPNRRFLFKRGETFPVSSSNTLNVDGPGIIGAYGTGAKPVWSHSGGNPIVMNNPDWRIMDIRMTTTLGTGDVGIVSAYNVPVSNYLLLRVDLSNFRINVISAMNSAASIHDLMFLVECSSMTPNEYAAILDGRRQAVLGCTMGEINTMQHVLRSGMLDKGTISHNYFHTHNGHHTIKLHSTTHGSGLPVTRFVKISDNHLRGGVWTVAMGPQNSSYDERVTQIVVERNLFDTESTTQVGLQIYAQDVSVRNNVFVGTGAAWYTGASVDDGGTVPAATRVRICNNTFYKADSGSGFSGIYVSSQVSNVTIQNNLSSAPLLNGDVLIQGSCPGLVADSNLVTDNAGFVDAAAGDYSLTSNSPARNDGLTLVGVIDDFTGFVTRPQGMATDLGAFERD